MKEKLGSIQNEADRDELDFYATNPKDVEELVQLLKLNTKSYTILEPCAGNGHIAKVLTKYGHTVITNDIIERDFKLDHVVDFLNDTIPLEVKPDIVITNPPFKYAKEFIEKSLEYADIVIVIARLDLLESKKRKALNQNHLKYAFVHTDRARFAKNGDDTLFDQGTAMSTGWFVYTKVKQEVARIEII